VRANAKGEKKLETQEAGEKIKGESKNKIKTYIAKWKRMKDNNVRELSREWCLWKGL
jgi:F0F1-type ATP synthase membrane subunit b/b'